MQDSHLTISEQSRNVAAIHTPRKSTLNFLRQFARTYATLSGTAFSAMNVN